MATAVDGGPEDLGAWLVEQRWALERQEAAWLVGLAEFDATGGWAAWGQLACVDWMVVTLGMGRSTAFEKLRVARELRRRPSLGDAYRAGRLSYSAARLISRAEGASPEVDEALVAVAEAGSVADVERAVRSYQLYLDQERPPGEGFRPRRGLRLRSAPDGLVRVDGYLSEAEAERLEAVLADLLDGGESPRGDSAAGSDGEESPRGDSAAAAAGEESPRGDSADGDAGGAEEDDWLSEYDRFAQAQAERRADALMDLVEIGARAGAVGAASETAERYLAHLVVGPDGTTTLLDGRPLPPGEAAVLRCDASTLVHHTDGDGRPLRLGRRTRVWSAAQRRAAAVRDGGRCRFPGCRRRVTHIHHLHHWAAGGLTDIDNGLHLCSRHHTLVHEGGFRIAGDPNAGLRFLAPDGRTIGLTCPVRRTAPRPHRVPSVQRRALQGVEPEPGW